MSKASPVRPQAIAAALLLLALVLMLVFSPGAQEPQDYFRPLLDFPARYGYSPVLAPLNLPPDTKIPIYDQTVWHGLTLNGETLWVYFDTSNRANYLAQQFCTDEAYGKVIYVGLRFILCYPGGDEKILSIMDEWQRQSAV